MTVYNFGCKQSGMSSLIKHVCYYIGDFHHVLNFKTFLNLFMTLSFGTLIHLALHQVTSVVMMYECTAGA